MHTSKKAVLAALLVLTTTAVILMNCREQPIISQWRQRDINIDGSDTDWGHSINYHEDRTRTSITVFNDSDYVYIKLFTANRKTARLIMALGLTVWFDSTTQERKEFGVHFPRGYRGTTLPFIRRGELFDNSGVPAMLDTLNGDLGILTGEESDTLVIGMDTVEQFGLKACIGVHSGEFVYEMRVPFKHDDSYRYAVPGGPGGTLSIGFETTKVTLDNMHEVLPEDKMRMNEYTRTVLTPEPLEVWLRVQLPSGPLEPGEAVN